MSLFTARGALRPASRIPFVDDFNDNSISSAKWTVALGGNITITEQNNRLELNLVDAPGINVATITSVPVFDFTDKEVQCDIIQWTTNNSSSAISEGMYLVVIDSANNNNLMQMGREQADLNGYLLNNGSSSSTNSGGAVPALTKIKIKHRSSDNKWLLYYYDTSWTLFWTSPAATWNPTAAKIQILVYEYHGTAGTQPFVIDNLTSTATY